MSKYENLWSYIKCRSEDTITLTFDEISSIAAAPIDHSFLRYKKELTECGWEVKKISMKTETVIFARKKEEK